MYTIEKELHFSASHRVAGLPPEHPCSHLHGHNYIIVLVLSSPKLNEVGFVEDYRDLDDVKKWVDDTLDHRHLNDVFKFNPTAENIAKEIYLLFKKDHPCLSGVRVKETPKTIATYEPGYDI